jgi:hypothetical protein
MSISKKASFQTGEKKKSKRNTHHDALVLSSSPTGSQILQQHTHPRAFSPSVHASGWQTPVTKETRASPRLCGLARSFVSLLSSLLSPSLPPSFVSARKRLASFLGWAFPFTVFWKKGGLLGFILLVLGTTPHVRLFPNVFFFSLFFFGEEWERERGWVLPSLSFFIKKLFIYLNLIF